MDLDVIKCEHRLFDAVRTGNEEWVWEFARADGNLLALNSDGNHALIVASELGMDSMIRVLLNFVFVDSKASNGDTALMFAGSRRIVDVLLAAGADPNVFNRHGENPLMRAVRQDWELGAIRGLVEAGANPAAANNDGYTAIMQAAANDRIDQLGVLLSVEVDLERADHSTGQTALGVAFSHGSSAAARLLIEKGANTAAQDKHGYSLLMRTIAEGNVDMAHLALEVGVSPCLANETNETPLMMASARDMPGVVERLLALRVDTNVVDRNGKGAKDLGSLQCIGLILSHEQAQALDLGTMASRHSPVRRM